jgi:hypothetical protein
MFLADPSEGFMSRMWRAVLGILSNVVMEWN